MQDAILTRAKKLAQVSLIYRTKPAFTKWKKGKKLKSKKQICSEVSVNRPGNPWSQFWKIKRRLRWRD